MGIVHKLTVENNELKDTIKDLISKNELSVKSNEKTIKKQEEIIINQQDQINKLEQSIKELKLFIPKILKCCQSLESRIEELEKNGKK